jgi:hypothetical protein
VAGGNPKKRGGKGVGEGMGSRLIYKFVLKGGRGGSMEVATNNERG